MKRKEQVTINELAQVIGTEGLSEAEGKSKYPLRMTNRVMP